MDVAMIYKSACDTKIDARFTPNAIRVGVQFAADKRGSCSHPGSRVSEPASLFVYPGLVFTIRLLPFASPEHLHRNGDEVNVSVVDGLPGSPSIVDSNVETLRVVNVHSRYRASATRTHKS